MATSDHLAFLLGELDQWRRRQLIDHATYERLRWFYAARHPMAADALDARCSASRSLPAPPPTTQSVDEWEHQLHEHVQLHFRFEELAAREQRERDAEREAASAEPVASRTSSLSGAVLEAASDLLVVDDAQPEPPTVEQQIVERESRWSATIRPFLHEKALWIAGALLTVAGSLYFLGLAWDRLDSVMLHFVIAAALHLYAAAFFGVGLTLVRRRQAHTVGRILFGFTVVLLPLGNLAVGELGAVLLQSTGPAGLLFGVGFLVVTLLAQGIMLAVIGGLYERRSITPLVEMGLAFAALTALVAPLSVVGIPPAVYVALLAVGLFALARAALTASRRLSLRMSILLLAGGASWALVVLVGRVHLAASFAPTHYATLLVAVAALYAVLDHRLRQRAGHPPRLTALGLSLHAAILLGLSTAIGGLVTLGYFDLSARLTVLACAATAAVMFARAAWLHGRSAMTHLAAFAGLFAYFFLPAPFLKALQLVHQWASGALGYANEPLPVAYYGLTFIPYVLALAITAWRLRPKRPDLTADLLKFLMVLGALLTALALSSTADLRPMLWTWPAYAVGCYVAARAFRIEPLHYAGHGLAMAFVCALGVWAVRLGLPLPPLMLLSVGAVPAAAASASRRTPKHVVVAAGAALAIAPLAGLFGGLTSATLAMAQGAAAIALALLVVRTRSTAVAVLSALMALGATVTSAIALDATVHELYWVLLSFGFAGAATAVALRRAPPATLRSTALALSAILAATLALSAAFLLGLATSPSWAPLLAAAVIAYLALVSRGAVLTPVAGLSLAVGIGLLADRVWPGGWPLCLAALSCAYLTAAANVPRSWPAARAKARALAVVSLVVLGAALCVLWWRAAPGNPAASWWGFAANSSVLAFALTGALLERARRPDLAAALLGTVAVFSALAASFVLEALVEVPSAFRFWLHGALLATVSLLWTGIARRLQHARLAQAARWVAGALALPSLGLVALAALISVLLGPSLSAPLATATPSWLDVSWPAILCAGLALLAVRAAAELRERRLGWHLGVAALVGLAMIVASAFFGRAHLAIPTALFGLALGVASAYGRELFGHPLPIGWSLGALALGLLSTHFDFTSIALPAVMACLTVALLLQWLSRLRPPSDRVAGAWSLALSVTFQVTMLWLAHHLSTGRYPPAAVLAFLGPAAVGAALVLRSAARALGRRRASQPVYRFAHANLLVAGVLVCAGVLAHLGRAPWFVVLSALSTLAVVAALLIGIGRADRRTWMLHAAAVVVPAFYLVLRSQTGLSSAGPLLDGVVLLMAGQLAFWLGRAVLHRDAPGAKALQVAAVWWPLLSVAIAPALTASGIALLGLLVAVHYAVFAQVAQDKHLSVPAMFFGNVALFSSWAVLGWSDLLAYAIPVGVTLLALIHVYAAELGRRPRKILRRIVVASLYVLSVGDALLAATPVQALVLVPILCVTGIAIGAVARVRVYLVMGVAFLAADLVLTMLRYGLESRPLGALFLTLLGLTLVSAMVLFSLHREQILRRYAMVLGELRAWE